MAKATDTDLAWAFRAWLFGGLAVGFWAGTPAASFTWWAAWILITFVTEK